MNKVNLNQSLKQLAQILNWFEDQKEVDVEAGLQKIKEGANLIKVSRERLKAIENEFENIKEKIKGDADIVGSKSEVL